MCIRDRIDGMDTFIGDMMTEMSTAGGAAGGITSMLSKLGDIKGNMTSALNFENIKMNVFPFELPPNKAVSDYYQFCSGGSGTKASQIFSKAAVTEQFVKGKKPIIPSIVEQFAQPTKATLNIDLRDNPIIKGLNEVGESLDEAFDNA